MDISPSRILQTGLAFWDAKVLLSAVEMELFTDLAKHPGNIEAVQGRMGLHPRSASDFLDALVALGFLQRADGVYSNTPETELFLDKNKPSYIGGILEMANSRLFPFWSRLTIALRTGEPQNETRDGHDRSIASRAYRQSTIERHTHAHRGELRYCPRPSVVREIPRRSKSQSISSADLLERLLDLPAALPYGILRHRP
jgi:hypothetical protein